MGEKLEKKKKNETFSFITSGRWVISLKLPTSKAGESRGDLLFDLY
jgi:hypothetical protein